MSNQNILIRLNQLIEMKTKTKKAEKTGTITEKTKIITEKIKIITEITEITEKKGLMFLEIKESPRMTASKEMMKDMRSMMMVFTMSTPKKLTQHQSLITVTIKKERENIKRNGITTIRRTIGEMTTPKKSE